MISQTSLQAFQKAYSKLVGRRLEVYNKIQELGEASNLQLSISLNLPINCITPRTHELETFQFIECSKVDYDPSNKFNTKVIFWKIR